MAREQVELWKTRDNGGKAAWLFIGVLSSVYWVSDVITDDELAVLIMRACSSRNLFVKHHLLKQTLAESNSILYPFPYPYPSAYPFPLSLETVLGHHYYTDTREHTSSSSYNTHIGLLVCIRA